MTAYLLFFGLLTLSAKTLLGWKLALLFAAASVVFFFPARPAAYVIVLFIATFFIKKKPLLRFNVVYVVSYLLLAALFYWFDRKFNYLLALPTMLGLALIAAYQYKDSKETALEMPTEQEMEEE